MSACAALLPAPDAGIPIEELDAEPRPAGAEVMGMVAAPTGPIVEIVRGRVDGEAFSITVHATVDGFCSTTSFEAGGSSYCGSMPGEGLPEFGPFGSFGYGGGDATPTEVSGSVASDVAAVWVELADGGRARLLLIDLAPAEMDAQAFIGFLPANATPEAIVALDALGNEMGRVPLVTGPVGPPGGAGATPTPGAP